MKYTKEFLEHFSTYPVFTMRDVKLFFKNKGLGNAYAQLLLHNFVKKGGLQRVSKGVYSFKRDPAFAGFAFQPFYYGLQEALSLHGLWEQETNPIVITPRRVRIGVRKFGKSNFVVRRVSRKMFFGFKPLRYYDSWLPVSTPEKTLIDFAYFRQKMQQSTLEEIAGKIDEEKLLEMLQKTPKAVAKKVLKLLEKGRTATAKLV